MYYIARTSYTFLPCFITLPFLLYFFHFQCFFYLLYIVCDISKNLYLYTFTHAGIKVKFILRNQTYLNNSIVAINDIGVGYNALLCVTDKPDCCNIQDNKMGEFYYPNNTAVGYSEINSLYRNRGPQVVRLNRRNDTFSPTGVYRCEIPDFIGMNQNIYINLTGMEMRFSAVY